ncbi:MAG: O-antigen ligase family protein [Gaiellaceae bacterium]
MNLTAALSRSIAAASGSGSHGGRLLPSSHPALLVCGAGLIAVAFGLLAAQVAGAPTQVNALLLVGIVAPYLAIALGVLRKFLLAVIVLDIPLGWDIHLGWRAEAAEIGATGGFGLSVTTAALAALYAIWFAESMVQSPTNRIRPQLRMALPVIMFVGVSALSILVATDVQLAGFGLWTIVQALLLFIYISSNIRTPEQVNFIVTLLLVGVAFVALASVAALIGFGVDIAGISTAASDSGRLSGTLGAPNGAGAYFAFLLAPAAAVALTAESGWRRGLAGFSFVMGVVALILTSSRGGWLAFLIAMAILSLWGVRARWLRPSMIVVGAVLLVTLVAPFAGRITERVTGADDRVAAESRLPLIKLAGDIIEDQPVTGVGVNNFTVAIPEYAGPEFTGAFLFAAPNKYLLVWAEAGIVALIAFAWFLLATVRRSWIVYAARDPVLSPLGLAFTGAIVGQMVHMTVDTFQGRQGVQLLWLSAAVVAAMSLIVVQGRRSATREQPARLST